MDKRFQRISPHFVLGKGNNNVLILQMQDTLGGKRPHPIIQFAFV